MVAGVTAAAAVADDPAPEPDPDAALLSLRAQLLASVADIGRIEMAEVMLDDEEIDGIVARHIAICWNIVNAPAAQTAAGRALKAAAAMQQLCSHFSAGGWSGSASEMAWTVLSELAGDAYVPPALPERTRSLCEPGRA